MSDLYRVLGSTSRTEFKVKDSRFIGEAIPVGTPQMAKECLDEIRRREHDATHHCFAYRTGLSRDEFRYSDDGEPSGTAGKPILRQIDSADLTNALVVVTRYYGGTKLGTGGLIRAYGNAAKAALSEATISTQIRKHVLVVSFSYADTSPAMHTIERFSAEIVASNYGDETALEIAVRASGLEEFQLAFRNALSGRCEIIDKGPV